MLRHPQVVDGVRGKGKGKGKGILDIVVRIVNITFWRFGNLVI